MNKLMAKSILGVILSSAIFVLMLSCYHKEELVGQVICMFALSWTIKNYNYDK